MIHFSKDQLNKLIQEDLATKVRMQGLSLVAIDKDDIVEYAYARSILKLSNLDPDGTAKLASHMCYVIIDLRLSHVLGVVFFIYDVRKDSIVVEYLALNPYAN